MKTILLLILSLTIDYVVSPAQVVTKTADRGPGSLRQAILDANAGLGSGEIVFNIPVTDANFDTQRGVFVLQPTSALPALTRDGLRIDGASQTAFTGNTNSVRLGSGGTVGSNKLPISYVEGPEVEIVGRSSISYGFLIAAQDVRIQGLAIYGYGQSRGGKIGNIALNSNGSRAWIEGNCLGSFADRTEDPGDAQRTGGCNIAADQADSVTVKNNLLVWAEVAGIYVTNHADGWWIEDNEVAHNDQTDDRLDGIDLAISRGSTVIGNRIVGNGGNGVDTHRAIGWHTIKDNTIRDNGKSSAETSGIRLYGLNNEVSNNIIAENAGAGILVTSGAANNTLRQNAIYQNGHRPHADASAQQIGIDVVKIWDNHERGTAPYITRNDVDDLDEGGNGLLNYPIVDKALLRGDSIFLAGWAPAGSTLEFYVGDRSDSAFPQGKRYLFSLVEGSDADQDHTHSGYDFPSTWGQDTTTRFATAVAAPTGVTEGTVLVATATHQGATSEFGPKTVLTASHLMPVAGCRQRGHNGEDVVTLGYHNHSTDTLVVAAGADNYFSTSASQPPTVFYPGTHLDVATVVLDTTEVQWVLQEHRLVLTTEQEYCPTDLGIALVASEALVRPGDTVWVTTTLENFSSVASHEVTATLSLPTHAVLLQAMAAQGTYQVSTGVWTVGDMPVGHQTTLAFQLVIHENTLVEGIVRSSSPPDHQPNNDQAIAHIAIDESSSGEDGGTESNGNLASKIAVRNFQRQQHDLRHTRPLAPLVFSHAGVRSGTIRKASIGRSQARTSATQEDLLLIPERSTASSRTVVVTPADLIGITNADELFSVDYLNERDQRLGAVLYIRTESQVYEHTKAICDRLNGGTLTDIRHVYVQGKPFILSRIDQPSGDIDYAISFVAYENETQYTIDNRWRNEEYRPQRGTSVLNFQVWSVSPTHTVDLVDQLLTAMQQQRTTAFLNRYPAATPAVYVKSGYYAEGQLHLTVNNTVQAQSADVWGTVAATEDGERSSFLTTLPLEPGEHQLSLPIEQVFDAGFTLANDVAGGLDVLYLADGPWGVDYERDGAYVRGFSTELSPAKANEGSYLLERNARMEGRVRTYASLFKSLRPGLLPQDLRAYRYLTLQASGSGDFEVIVTKESITSTAEQFRYRFKLNHDHQLVAIPFASLTNRFGERRGEFRAEDVTSIVFNALGDGKMETPFALNVEEVTFRKQDYVLAVAPEGQHDASVAVYPNPAHRDVTIQLTRLLPGEPVEVTLLDLAGRSLQTIGQGSVGDDGRWQYTTEVSVPPGVYLIKVVTSNLQHIVKFVKQ